MAVAKKKSAPFQYVRATVDFGELVVEGRRYGKRLAMRLFYPEDVTDVGEEDIILIAKSMLDVPDDDPVKVEVRYN